MKEILTNWPLTVVCVAMIVAAVIDGWKLKVPNWLTFPVIATGLLLGLAHSFAWLPESTGKGGFWEALAGVAVGCLLLLPIYSVGGMGAGDVKMQMGFGAWICAFYGAKEGVSVVIWAFMVGVVIGGVIAVGMMLYRRHFKQNLTNTKDILGDLSEGSVMGANEKAAARKHRMHLLPYGIPLCIGYIGYLVYLHGF